MPALGWFAWSTVAYNIAVILWGAYVRATGSGAGCGNHWPLCNGDVIPRSPSVHTLIEYSHRVTSGLALLAVLVLFWWIRRERPPGHPARRAAGGSLILIVAEAGLGAGLVLFQLVADNASMARALFMAAHLVNTFLLLAALTLTAHWTAEAPIRVSARPATWLTLSAFALGLLLVGSSGAIAALGNTLYPSGSLAEGLAADLSPTSHLLIRLRIMHPVLAVTVALLLVATIRRLPFAQEQQRGRRAANAVAIIALVQLAAGFANMALLAPLWLQLAHLLLADCLWIAFVVAGASALGGERVPQHVGRHAHVST